MGQIDVTPTDIEKNLQAIIERIDTTPEGELIVFPEMAVT